MKSSFYKILFYILLITLVLTSCRSEESEFIQPPKEDTITAKSNVASLMLKTTSNDGSNDNIIDTSNCFNIKLPITVTANAHEIDINTEDDYKIIEYYFDEDDDDIDELIITFPVTIVLSDFSEINVNSNTELYSYSNGCNGENEIDDDIECIDFKYPVTASTFNSNSELISKVTFPDDYQLHKFINTIGENDFVSVDFPISLILSDETELSINNVTELENTIKDFSNDCDEDDDYNYNDDDCIDCNTNTLITILTNCSDWTVDKLERYGNNYDDAYSDYTFNFSPNGSLVVYWSGITAYGTWSASGTGNNITVAINVPDLPYCNNDWILHEISQYTKSKIDLRVGNNDRMRYENNCN